MDFLVLKERSKNLFLVCFAILFFVLNFWVILIPKLTEANGCQTSCNDVAGFDIPGTINCGGNSGCFYTNAGHIDAGSDDGACSVAGTGLRSCNPITLYNASCSDANMQCKESSCAGLTGTDGASCVVTLGHSVDTGFGPTCSTIDTKNGKWDNINKKCVECPSGTVWADSGQIYYSGNPIDLAACGVVCTPAAPTVTVTPATYSGPAATQTFSISATRADSSGCTSASIPLTVSCTVDTPSWTSNTTSAVVYNGTGTQTMDVPISASGKCTFIAKSPDNSLTASKTVDITVVPAGGTWIRYSTGGFYIAHDCSTGDYFNKSELDGQTCVGGTWQNCLNNSPLTGAYDCFIGFGVDCITTTKRCSDKFYAGDCDCVPAAGVEICNNGIDDSDPDTLVDCADIVDCPNDTLCSGGGTCSGGACVPAGPPNVHIDTCASCNPVGTGPCQNMLNNNLWTAISAPTTSAMCSTDTNVSSICAAEIAGGFNGCQVGLSNGFTCPCGGGPVGCVVNTCGGSGGIQRCLVAGGAWTDCPGGGTCSGAGVCSHPAGAPCSGPGMFISPLGPGYCTIGQILTKATNWILALVSSIIILVIIIGGLMYITSAGDEERLRTSKNIIYYAIVGLGIILISYALITEVVNLLN